MAPGIQAVPTMTNYTASSIGNHLLVCNHGERLQGKHMVSTQLSAYMVIYSTWDYTSHRQLLLLHSTGSAAAPQ